MSRLIKSMVAYPVQPKQKVISIKKFQSTLQSEIEIREIEESSPIELLQEAKNEAEQMILAATKEKEAILAAIQEEKIAWEQTKIQLMNEAKEEGYNAGWKEGEQKGYKEYVSCINEAQNIIEAAKKDYQVYLESSEQTILNLSLSIAAKIVASKIEDDQGYFLSLVKKAIKEVKSLPDVQILVHPSQYEFLLKNKSELLSVFINNASLSIYPDDDLTEGSCLIESAYGRIDASVDIQLVEIKKALTQCLEGIAL